MSVVKLKKSSVANNVPSTLEYGELAINYTDGRIYYKDNSNIIGAFIDSDAIAAKIAAIAASGAVFDSAAARDLIDEAYILALGYDSQNFDIDLANRTTDNLLQGTTNLYYTKDRVDSDITLNVDQNFVNGLLIDATTFGLNTPSYYLNYNNLSNLPPVPIDSAGVRNIFSVAGALTYDSATGQFGTTGLYSSSSFDTDFALKSTDDVTEGSINQYYLKSRADSDADDVIDTKVNAGFINSLNIDGRYFGGNFDSDLSTKTTDDLVEGSGNLYYTNARVLSEISTAVDKTYVDGLNIDANTLDGQLGAYYLSYANFTGTPPAALDSSGTRGLFSASGDISYNVGTGVFSYTAQQTYLTANFDSDLSTKTTDDLAVGSVNLYYTAALFDSSLATKSTSDLAEGSNLYWTDARWNTLFDNASTDSLNEGSNLYYTEARVDANIASKSTSDLAEGSNLYFTSVRGDANFSTNLAAVSTDDLSEGPSNLYYTLARDDSAFDARLALKSTSDLGEGANLYYTSTRVDSDIDGRVNSAFVEALLPNYVTLDGTQTLTNKTLTTPVISSPTISTSITLDTAEIYSQPYGSMSFNEINNYGDSTQTVYQFGSGSDSAKVSAVISLGVTDTLVSAIGVTGNATRSTMVIGSVGSHTDIEFKRNLTTSPFNLDGATTDMRLDSTGRVSIISQQSSISKTTGSLVVDGGVGVQGAMYIQDVYAQFTVNAPSIIGTLTGTASSIANHNTTALVEGTNLYHTPARARSAISASGSLSYNSTTGVMSYTERTNAAIRGLISTLNVSGDGDIAYNSSTGVLSYTGPSATETRAHFTGGLGVTITAGSVAIGQAVGINDSVTFSSVHTTGNVLIDGDLFVTGTQTVTNTQTLAVKDPYIHVADSNTADLVDMGFIGHYFDGVDNRHTGLVRDATDGEYHLFTGLIQNNLDDSVRPGTIDVGGTGWTKATLNVGSIKGQFAGFDSDQLDWQQRYTGVITSNYTAVPGDRILTNTAGGVFTVTLPATPAVGTTIEIMDVTDSDAGWSSTGLILARNGSTIENYVDDFNLDIGQQKINIIYTGTTWHLFAQVGQRGPEGLAGADATIGQAVTKAQAVAYAVALG